MKILFLTLEYPPQNGGVASYYFGVVSELKRRGHEVEVVRGGDLLGWLWPRWMKGYFTVRKLIKKEKTDFLFVGHVLPLGTVAYLLRRRVPYVVFTHGMDVLIAQKSWRKRWLLKKILAHAKLVVANSEFTKQQIDKLESIVVYPCPSIVVDAKHEEVEVLRRKLGLSGKKVLLTLGRVVERKGHDMVLHALPEILEHVPNAVYVVAGDGPDLERLQKMVAESPPPQSSPIEGEGQYGDSTPLVGGARGGGLQSYVRFVGTVSDEDRARYFSLCDLLVMPSRQIGPDVEGFGIVYLEAALFEKPSIGGRSGGVPEAILDGKTGALVDPADAGALARVAVQLLRDDGLRDELGKNARARVLQEFTWEKQVEKLVTKFS